MTRTQRSDEWLNNNQLYRHNIRHRLFWLVHHQTMLYSAIAGMVQALSTFSLLPPTLISLLNSYHIIIKCFYEMMPCSLGNWYQLIGGRHCLGRQVRRNTLRSLLSYIHNTIIFNLYSFILKLETVNPSGRAVWGVGLRSLSCWGCGLESHWSMDVCLLWLLCVVR